MGGLTNSMAVARASVDKVTAAAIDNTKAVAASSSGLLQEASTSLKEVTEKTMSEEDIRQHTLRSLKKGSVMTTKGLNKVKQITLDMAGARQIVGTQLLNVCVRARACVRTCVEYVLAGAGMQNSFKTGAELLQSVTEDSVAVANPVDVASLVSVAKDANAEQAAHLVLLISDRVRRPVADILHCQTNTLTETWHVAAAVNG